MKTFIFLMMVVVSMNLLAGIKTGTDGKGAEGGDMGGGGLRYVTK